MDSTGINVYFINMPFGSVQFGNITSQFYSVASFCFRFEHLGTNCSLHTKELPISGLPISSLVHTLNDKCCHYFLYNPCIIHVTERRSCYNSCYYEKFVNTIEWGQLHGLSLLLEIRTSEDDRRRSKHVIT